jgi:hypothetical protein
MAKKRRTFCVTLFLCIFFWIQLAKSEDSPCKKFSAFKKDAFIFESIKKNILKIEDENIGLCSSAPELIAPIMIHHMTLVPGCLLHFEPDVYNKLTLGSVYCKNKPGQFEEFKISEFQLLSEMDTGDGFAVATLFENTTYHGIFLPKGSRIRPNLGSRIFKGGINSIESPYEDNIPIRIGNKRFYGRFDIDESFKIKPHKYDDNE